MNKSRKLKDRGIRIEDDLTWKKTKMRWNLKEIANQERRPGKRVRVGYGKIQIKGTWWKWNEEEEKLSNWQEKVGWKQGEDEGKA